MRSGEKKFNPASVTIFCPTFEKNSSAMQTITVQVLNDQAMPMLRQMERDKVVKLVHPLKSTQRLAKQFETLFQQWKKETLLLSDGYKITEHPAYRQIIALGEAVVPFILIKLREDPQHIFYALFKITGENPIKPEHVGKLSKMAEDWLNWGTEKGYTSR